MRLSHYGHDTNFHGWGYAWTLSTGKVCRACGSILTGLVIGDRGYPSQFAGWLCRVKNWAEHSSCHSSATTNSGNLSLKQVEHRWGEYGEYDGYWNSKHLSNSARSFGSAFATSFDTANRSMYNRKRLGYRLKRDLPLTPDNLGSTR